VVNIIKQFKIKNIILDPIIISSSEVPLLHEEEIDTIKNELVPIVRVITPIYL
jgi:hydroxymethylpyrimidine/phosphomethylpyrimidine kinase